MNWQASLADNSWARIETISIENDGLIEKGFDKDHIIVYNDVRDAYTFINTLTGKKEVYALFENDLPDTYNE